MTTEIDLPEVGVDIGIWGPLLNNAILAVRDQADAAAAQVAGVIAGTISVPGAGGGGVVGKSWDNYTGGFATHRTGGPVPYMLPASPSAIEACIANGQAWLDIDVRWNNLGVAPGKLWVTHEDDLALFTDATGLVRNVAAAQMTNTRHLASKTTGGRYRDEPILEFGDMLDRYAGRIPIMVEPKNQVSLTDWQKSIDLLAAAVISRGLEKSVLISFSGPDLATVTSHANIIKQYPSLIWAVYLITGDAGINDMSYLASVADLGVYHVTVPLGATQAYVDGWKARGVQVTAFANRQYNVTARNALGITGSNSDYAIYDNKAHTTIKQDYWRNGYWGVGDYPATGHNRPKLVNDGLVFDAPVSNQQWMMAGDFSQLPNAFTLDLEGTVLTAGAPWYGGIGFCQQVDASFATGGGGFSEKSGYYAFLGTSGNPSLYSFQGTTTGTQLATGSGTYVALGAASDYWIRVVVTATDITVTNRDPVTGAQVGVAAVSTNTAYRRGFLHVGGQLNTGSMKIRRVTVT
jgi:hypothetical protein